MAIYIVVATDNRHNVWRQYAHGKRDAIFQAERLFNQGKYQRVLVIRQDAKGRLARLHCITQPETAAETAARQASYPGAR